MEYSRWYEDLIKNGLKHSRVVIVSGVRQCGKTTLLKRIYSDSDNNFTFRSLDDDDLLQLALDDPKGFIKHQAKTMIIDEVQKAPKLLPAVKMAVDKSNDKGQFLLTGSADINLLPEVYESLAGRIRNIRLRPLTQGEILLRKPSFLNNVLKLKFPAQIKGYDKREIVKLAFRGGYPEVLTLSEKERNSWFKNYVNAILMRDLRNISNISRFESIISLFPILSSWSSKFIDLSAIATNLGTSRNTLRSYITLLKTLFLFDEIPAWITTDYERAAKRDKFFATDTGIMASVLGWEQSEVLLNSDKSGKLIETFVFNELSAQAGLSDDYKLYHYRDRNKREIDFIIECPGDKLIAIEVKSGETANFLDFKHIEWFRNNVAKNKKIIGIVLYGGENVLQVKKDNYVIPIPLLWN